MIDITQIFTNTLSGLITNLPWFILVIWSVKTIVKQMPHWIDEYDKVKMKHYQIERALGHR